MNGQTRGFLITVVSFLFIIAAGFPNSAEARKNSVYQSDAASLLITPLVAIRWDDIVIELQPEFELSETEALKLAVPKTADVRSISSRRSGLSVNFGNAGILESFKRVTDNLAPTKSTDTTTVEKANPKAAAESDEIPPTLLPTLSALTGQTGKIDPFLQYSIATSLMQEVALLNNYLKHAVMKNGYSPYLVRFNVSPRMTGRASVDTLASNISFLPSSKITSDAYPRGCSRYEFGDPAVVVPLVVTENAQASGVDQQLESARKLGIAFSDIVSGGLLGLNAGSQKNSVNQISTTSVRSTFSVARATEGSLELQLSAPTGAEDGSVAERHYTVTVMILVPNKTLADRKCAVAGQTSNHPVESRVRLVSLTQARTKGYPLKTRTREQELRRTALAIANHCYVSPVSRKRDVKNYVTQLLGSAKGKDGTADEIDNAILDGDYAAFSTLIKRNSQCAGSATTSERQALWGRLSMQASSRPWVRADITLPTPGSVSFPDTGFAYLIQDSGKRWDITLDGGKNLHADLLKANLVVQVPVGANNEKRSFLIPGKLSSSLDRRSLQLSFPSPASLKITGYDSASDAKVVVSANASNHREPIGCDGNGCEKEYENFHYVNNASAASNVKVQLTAESGAIKPDKAGIGEVAFTITANKKSDGSLVADKIRVGLTNTQIVSVSSKTKLGVTSSVQVFNGAVTVSPNTRTVVKLKNFDPQKPVKLVPTAFKGNTLITSLVPTAIPVDK